MLRPEDLGLPSDVTPTEDAHDEESSLEGGLQAASSAAVRSLESRIIKKVLTSCGGNKSRTAEKLRVSYKTLLTKIEKYKIERPEQ